MVDNETLGVHKSGHPIIAISIYIQLCNCIAAFNYLKAFLWVGKNISGLASSLIVKKGNIILIKVKKTKKKNYGKKTNTVVDLSAKLLLVCKKIMLKSDCASLWSLTIYRYDPYLLRNLFIFISYLFIFFKCLGYFLLRNPDP